jgi:hypothetical protein
MIAMSAASSHQKSRSNAPSSVATLAPNATLMARPTSNIIPGRRVRTSSTAPARKGHPP